MTAIYDTMQFVKPDIQTVCLGQAASAAAVLLAAGHAGQAVRAAELADPDPPAVHRGRRGQGSDIEIQANEILRMRALLEEHPRRAHRA